MDGFDIPSYVLWNDKLQLVELKEKHYFDLTLDDMLYFSVAHEPRDKKGKTIDNSSNYLFEDIFGDIKNLIESFVLGDPYDVSGTMFRHAQTHGSYIEVKPDIHDTSVDTTVPDAQSNIKISIPNVCGKDWLLYVSTDLSVGFENIRVKVALFKIPSSMDCLNIFNPKVDARNSHITSKRIETTDTYEILFTDERYKMWFVEQISTRYLEYSVPKFYDFYHFVKLRVDESSDMDWKVSSITKVEDTEETKALFPLISSEGSNYQKLFNTCSNYSNLIQEINQPYIDANVSTEDMIGWVLAGQFPHAYSSLNRKEIGIFVNPCYYVTHNSRIRDTRFVTAIIVVPMPQSCDIYELFYYEDTKELHSRVYSIPRACELNIRAFAGSIELRDVFTDKYLVGLYKITIDQNGAEGLMRCIVSMFTQFRSEGDKKVEKASQEFRRLYDNLSHFGVPKVDLPNNVIETIFPNQINDDPDITDVRITHLNQPVRFALDISQLEKLVGKDTEVSYLLTSNLISSLCMGAEYDPIQKGGVIMLKIIKYFNNLMHKKQVSNELMMNLGLGIYVSKDRTKPYGIGSVFAGSALDFKHVIVIAVPMVDNNFIIFFLDMDKELCFVSTMDQTEFIERKKRVQERMDQMRSKLANEHPGANILSMIEISSRNQIALSRDHYKTLRLVCSAARNMAGKRN